MSDAALLALSVDRAAAAPLFQQICDALRAGIAAGRIAPGARLPASRTFAAELGVSRATVVTAYDQLTAEGYAQSRRGSGIFVSAEARGESGPVGIAASGLPRAAPPAPAGPAGPAGPVPPGLPDMRLFPHRDWGRCVARVARAAPESLVTAQHDFGDPRLRAAISRHLAEWRGLDAPPARILITAGAGDALEIAIRSLARPGDRIALENPGYLPLRDFSRSLGLDPVWLAVGEAGALPPSLRGRAPVLSVITPSHQFPLGGAMPLAARRAFLAHAAATGGWIVEDDFDSEFRYAGRPIPALASLDGGAARTIYVGSFSKIFSTGLRLGFLAAPAALIPAFAATLARFGVRASIAPQRPLAAFIEEGGFHRHIRRMRRIYGARRRACVAALQSELGAALGPGAGPGPWFADHQAGMQIALHLPPGADDRDIAARALRRGVSCRALSRHCAGGVRRRGLLIGFCACEPEAIAGRMRALREVIRA